MTLKNILLVAFLSIGLTSFSQKQKIKLKDSQVLSNGIHVMDYSKLPAGAGVILSVKGSEVESVMIETASLHSGGDLFTKVKFLELDIVVEISTYTTNKGKVLWMINEGIISDDWTFDEEKIKLFEKKFDENISGS